MQHKDGHGQVAQMLIDREVIFADDVENVFGKRPWVSRSDEIIAENERIEKEREEAEKREADEKERKQKAEIDKILAEAGAVDTAKESGDASSAAAPAASPETKPNGAEPAADDGKNADSGAEGDAGK